MIHFVEKCLQKIGILPPWDENDLLNAEIEDKAREHTTITSRLHEAFYRRLATNQKLRESITLAKERTNSFEEFEEEIRKSHGIHH